MKQMAVLCMHAQVLVNRTGELKSENALISQEYMCSEMKSLTIDLGLCSPLHCVGAHQFAQSVISSQMIVSSSDKKQTTALIPCQVFSSI